MPTQMNVVARLLCLGFDRDGQPGIGSAYRSSDPNGPSIPLEGNSIHLALSAAQQPGIADGVGSVYVHRPHRDVPGELREQAVLVANGVYRDFFVHLVPPSGSGKTGNAAAWCGVALENLLRRLEQQWQQ